jgi:hypothetical protein
MGGQERRLQLLHLREGGERRRDVVDRRPEGGILHRVGLGLDQDDFALLLGLFREAGIDDLVGPGGLADVAVVGLEVLRSNRLADEERR